MSTRTLGGVDRIAESLELRILVVHLLTGGLIVEVFVGQAAKSFSVLASESLLFLGRAVVVGP